MLMRVSVSLATGVGCTVHSENRVQWTRTSLRLAGRCASSAQNTLQRQQPLQASPPVFACPSTSAQSTEAVPASVQQASKQGEGTMVRQRASGALSTSTRLCQETKSAPRALHTPSLCCTPQSASSVKRLLALRECCLLVLNLVSSTLLQYNTRKLRPACSAVSMLWVH